MNGHLFAENIYTTKAMDEANEDVIPVTDDGADAVPERDTRHRPGREAGRRLDGEIRRGVALARDPGTGNRTRGSDRPAAELSVDGRPAAELSVDGRPTEPVTAARFDLYISSFLRPGPIRWI
jgi:hypothetical protein